MNIDLRALKIGELLSKAKPRQPINVRGLLGFALVLAISAGFICQGYWIDQIGAVETAQHIQDTNAIRYQLRTLELATEFGYDPRIVIALRPLVKQEFQRAHKTGTWRYIDTADKFEHLMLSMIEVESGGDPKAYNAGGQAHGLTQLQIPTARYYDKNVTAQQLFTISKNLQIAVRHMGDLLEAFNGNFTLATMAWNRGQGAVGRTLAAECYPGAAYATKVALQ